MQANKILSWPGLKRHHVWNGFHNVTHEKVNELLVHKLVVGQKCLKLDDKQLIIVVIEPTLAVVGVLLAGNQINEVAVLLAFPLEVELVAGQVAEVLLGLCRV